MDKGKIVGEGTHNHLLDSCRREGIPVRYEYIEVADQEDLIRTMACYNNSSKAWQLRDYIKAFSFCNPDYLTLLNTDESQSSKSSLDLPSKKESNSVIELKNMQKLYKNIEMAYYYLS